MSTYCVQIAWDEVPHLDEETKKQLLGGMLPHMREARTKGIPMLGAGAIYPLPESLITCEPFEIPAYWPKAYGMDVGWNKTAAVWGAWDRQSDTVYIWSDYYVGQAPPAVHASAIAARGAWMVGAIDPASAGSNQKDGTKLLDEYRALQLRLVEADNAVEAGILAVYQRMARGGLKIFTTCRALISEVRIYRRDEKGKIVKENDHACLHPNTRVLTRRGPAPIKDLVGTTGQVLTLGGRWVPYRNCVKTGIDREVVEVAFDDGSKVICTPDHRFMTVDGWIAASELFDHYCYNALSDHLGHSACDPQSLTRLHRNSTVSATIDADATIGAMDNSCTGLFGTSTTIGVAHPPGGSMFTTSTVTRPTTNLRTWLLSRAASIKATICASLAGLGFQQRPSRPRELGMGRWKAPRGIFRTMSICATACIYAASSIARTAGLSLRLASPGAIASARTIAGPNIGGSLNSIMSSANAWNAGPSSSATSTARQSPVAASVPQGFRCVSVSSKGRSDVYCLEVPETAAFAVETGVVVHNCDALRYLILTGMRHASVEPVEEEDGEDVRGSRSRSSVTGY